MYSTRTMLSGQRIPSEEARDGYAVASEHFIHFLMSTVPQAASRFGAENLQIAFPDGRTLLLQDEVQIFEHEKTLWDITRRHSTWALYEPSHEDREGVDGYKLTKSDSGLLALVVDRFQIPPGKLELAQTPEPGKVGLENSLVLARLNLVPPEIEKINRVVAQYNQLHPDLWYVS